MVQVQYLSKDTIIYLKISISQSQTTKILMNQITNVAQTTFNEIGP